MRKIGIWIAVLLTVMILSATAYVHAGPADNPQVFIKSKPGTFSDPAQSTEQLAALKRELARLERDYMRVVKYYNNELSDRQALQIAQYVLLYSTYYEIDPRLIMAVIVVESKFEPRAVSPKGAMGLGQLMPGTASMLGVKNAFDVRENIYGTVVYLRQQYDRWQHSDRVLDLMLASYNAGPEAVAKHHGIPPYRETQDYVVKVKKLLRFFIYGY